MNKVLLILLMGTLFNIGYSQSVEYGSGKKKTFYIAKTGGTDCKMAIKNIKGSELILEYKRILADTSEKWEFTLCDNFQCIGELVEVGTFYPMKDKELTEFKLTPDPKGHADTSRIMYEFWDRDTPNVKDTLEYTMILAWGLNTETAENPINFYPNPVKNSLNISLTDESVVEVFSLQGKLLLQETMGVTNDPLDVSSLKSGMYMLRVTTGESQSSAKIIKE